MHPLRSPFVRDQLDARARRLNEHPVRAGEFVLYWMQSTRRVDDNWTLRYAVLEADRLSRPLIVLHELSPATGREALTDEVLRPTARHWHFLLQGTRDLARDVTSLGIPFLFLLQRTAMSSAVATLAARASLVVTDENPVGGASRRAVRLASSIPCPMIAIESTCVVPAALFPREEYAPRTFRPKVMALLDAALEPAEMRGPKHQASPALVQSIRASLGMDPLHVESMSEEGVVVQVRAAAVDQSVPAVASVVGGRLPGMSTLRRFLDGGLAGYARRWKDACVRAESSGLSPYLRWGQISAATVAREVRASGGVADVAAFLDGLVVSRELAYNTCLRAPDFTSLAALPAWALRSMEHHGTEPRPHLSAPSRIEAGETGLPLWDLAQRELRDTGSLPQHLRKLWGKTLITMTPTYAAAHATLLSLNTRYALDGGDASGYAGALWCFGRYDRPFRTTPVWGHIRPMLLTRHGRTVAGQEFLAAAAS